MKALLELIGSFLRSLFDPLSRLAEPLPSETIEAVLDEAAHEEENLPRAA
jgi:hypothetical protein